MKRIWLVGFFALLGCGCWAAGGGHKYYVKTVDEANRLLLEPGDSVFFRGGQVFVGTVRVRAVAGSLRHPIWIGSYGTGEATINGGDSSGLVLYDARWVVVKGLRLVGAGRKQGNVKDGLGIVECQHIRVDGVDITGFQKSGLFIYSSADVVVSGVYAHENGAAGIAVEGPYDSKKHSRDLRILNCRADDNPGDPTNLTNHSGNGIVCGHCTHLLIDHCSASNNGWDMPRIGNGPVGIWCYEADSVTIQHCLAYRNKTSVGGADGGGFDLDGGVTNSVIQYCLSYGNQGSGYCIFQYWGASPWYHNIIRFNITEDDGLVSDSRVGIYVWNSSNDPSQFYDCQVYNNTVYNTREAALSFSTTSARRGFVFRDNIFVGADSLIRGDRGADVFKGNDWWVLRSASGSSGKPGDAGLAGLFVKPDFKNPGGTTVTDVRGMVGYDKYKTGNLKGIGAGLAMRGTAVAQPWPALDTLRYGAAYYYEYMPQDRLAKDVQLMKAAGINTVRIAESTWGVWEPRDGVFDFSKLDRVLDAMEGAGIGVIIGTPTYAIPTWLAKEHPEVLVMTRGGRRMYGARQNMDIVSPVFRHYAERIIRQLVMHVRNRRCVIGYQADNETKSYGNMGPTMQGMFVQSLRRRFGSPAAMNRAYGLNYWSNSINDWSAFPSMAGNINASLGCAYAAFQRQMVTEYLAWQVGIIRALKQPDQFITQNFDLEWRGSSYGIQPDVDHFAAAKAFDIAGIDIYHATADRLTGSEIAFGGDLARCMKHGNYLVMETQAQSLAGHQELPYPGQLRLQAYSHLASGADMVEYWPWMSLPNAVETYWKGVLSHDGEPNPVYEEVKQVGQEWKRIGDRLIHLKVPNRVAIFFSNASLTALGWFPFSDSLEYNDIVRREYDALYSMNMGCDLVNETSTNLSDYSLLVVPPLYCVSDSVLKVLNDYVRRGGHIVYSCKSGFTNEDVQVRGSVMPGPLREAVGASYQLFTNIASLRLAGDPLGVGSGYEVHDWAEMLVPEGAMVVGKYDHPVWGQYAAITHHGYGKGSVWYLGTIPSAAVLHRVMASAVKEAGLWTVDQELDFPVIVRSGVNKYGREVHYYFNYSGSDKGFVYRHRGAVELLTGKSVGEGDSVVLPAWGVMIMEEGGAGASGDGGHVTDWLDTDGHFINAHGAGVMYHDGVYYLYGEIKKGKTWLVPGQDWEDYRVDAGGVSCYSSRDMTNWKNEGVALAPDHTDTASDLYIGRVIERPKVIYNSVTRQYVMWMHIDRDDYGYARAGVAVSDKPAGPFRYLGSVRPNGQMSRDMTVFQDDDGRAYLVYASENNNTMQVCLLAPDYLSPTTVYKRILIGQRREAPALFKAGGKYYLITSLCSGWDPNAARVAVADSMLGEWVQDGNPCVGPDSETTFQSQSTYVAPLVGDRFLFMADRWNKKDLERSGYLWLPLTVRDGRVEIRGPGATGGGTTDRGTTDTGMVVVGPETREWSKRVNIGSLALMDYSIMVRAETKAALGHSFIRCYDPADRLLLEFTEPISDTGKYVETGNYTETPVGTAYAVIGVRKDSVGGELTIKDFKIEPNIGETLAPHEPLCDLRQYLKPFWKSDTILNETVLMYSAGGGPAGGRLLFEPDRILSVRSFGLDTVFREGEDYRFEGRRILRLAGSRMPFRADTSFDRTKDLAWYNLQSKWVVVTYTHHDPWPGPVPAYKGGRLPVVMGKLSAGKPVTIVAYGMSITRGFDVSGYDGVAPYMPTYMELFADGLRWQFPGAKVQLCNAGLPGSTVSWGAQYVSSYVNPLEPDLVVIDFGMNDFWRMSPAEFRDSVASIIRQVRAVRPGAEFLLLANMKFDPDYVLDSDKYKKYYLDNLAGYRDVLAGMEGPGVVMMDMTTLSDAIYKRKKAKDCIVNPLHPNDYLARWYAQGMLATVVGGAAGGGR